MLRPGNKTPDSAALFKMSQFYKSGKMSYILQTWKCVRVTVWKISGQYVIGIEKYNQIDILSNWKKYLLLCKYLLEISKIVYYFKA